MNGLTNEKPHGKLKEKTAEREENAFQKGKTLLAEVCRDNGDCDIYWSFPAGFCQRRSNASRPFAGGCYWHAHSAFSAVQAG